MPIKSDLIPAENSDLLGRTRIAREIVSGLLHYSNINTDGICVAVSGPWGSGKSTLLSFITNQLKEDPNNTFDIVYFNPWIFQKDEGIKEAFLLQLAQALGGVEAKTRPLSKTMLKYIKAFRWIKYINGAAGNIQDGLENVIEQLTKESNVYEIKVELDKLLQKSKKKILIIIDDLDRLPPDKIVELIQTITLVTNFSNFVYMVAFDREIVISALNSVLSGKGQEYLEKVIQVEYEIPRIQEEKLELLFRNAVSDILQQHKLLLEENKLSQLWSFHGLKDYFQSIRDFKRYENALAFRLPGIIDEVSTIDFLALEAIRIFDYKSYQAFYKYFRINRRRQDLPNSGLKEEQWKELSETASEIIRFLGSPEEGIISKRDTNQKSLLDPLYFDRYFTLLKNESDIGEKELGDFFSRPTRRFKILDTAAKFNRLENMVDRLKAKSIHQQYAVRDYSIVKVFIDFFNQKGKLFEEMHHNIIDMLINLLCGGEDKGDNLMPEFIRSYGTSGNMSSFIHIYLFHYLRVFQKDGKRFRNDLRVFNEFHTANWDFIEKKFLPLFKAGSSHMKDAQQTKNVPFIKYLYQRNFAELFPTDYEELYNSFFDDQDYLLYILRRNVEVNYSGMPIELRGPLESDPIFTARALVYFKSKLQEIAPQSLSHADQIAAKFVLGEIDLDD